MGLKFRTALGALREQRRHAEVSRPPLVKRSVSLLKARALNSLHGSPKDSEDQSKSLLLLERLRQTLQDDQSPADASKDLESLEDELARINIQHLAKNSRLRDSVEDLPLNLYRGSNQPFSLVVIQGEKNKNFDFSAPIPRLEAPLSNFDPYLKNLYSVQESVRRPTLVSVKESQGPRSPKDHSDEAADLVQETMTKAQNREVSPIPTSLALSLLND